MNPPFIEKAAMVGLRQLHVAVRSVSGTPACEVVVAGDLHAGMRMRWRLSAATSMGAMAAGIAAGVGIAGPAAVGAALVGGLTVALFGATYRYYRGQVEESLTESLGLLESSAQVASMAGVRFDSDSKLPPDVRARGVDAVVQAEQ